MTIERLQQEGHADIEGGFTLSKCAGLGRNYYCIAAVERELEARRRFVSQPEARIACFSYIEASTYPSGGGRLGIGG